MKNTFRFKRVFVLILFISTFFIVYSFINPDISDIIRYIAIFVAASSLTYLYVVMIGNRNIRKIDWMENRLRLWNSIAYRVKKAGENSFNEMPLGIVVYNDERVIEWANNYAKEIFLSPLVDRKIELINQELYTKIKLLSNFDITIYGRTFGCTVLNKDNIIYLIDKTEIKSLEKRYNQRMLALGIINLDNLTQALSTLDAQERAKQMSNIIGIISEWSNKYNIYLRGYSEEQFLIIMDHQQLEQLIEEQFRIIDDIKEYFLKEDLRITASIGMACQDISASNLYELAEAQLSLAINRGGSQAVVFLNGQVTYFGAKTTSFESRSPIYVRVKAESLCDFIEGSSKVYIMAHEGMDADAFGASLAMQKLVKALNREGKIVFEEDLIDETVYNIYSVIQSHHVNILDYLISSKEAISKMTDDTLLIIVDCQYQNLLLSDKVYKKAKRIAIIDHHRRNNFAINNYNYLYAQSSASSTVEMIVEMYEYLETEIELTGIEATWMLLGIVVDTNNLMYRASYRTFNVLSKLSKFGADMSKVQIYLRESIDDYTKRNTILGSMELIENKYAIAIATDEIFTRSFIAKIADDLMLVNTIKAAFCIGRIEENEIAISARSLDDFNVQIIMEQLGGGGHYNNAAAQFKDTDINTVKELLKEKLKNIDEGGIGTMKIILTSDVKGKGKKGDIIDIPAGHANFLIKSKQAILATVDNIKQLEKAETERKANEEKELVEAKELKVKVDNNPVTVGVKVGKEGKLFGTVSSKHIVEEYKNQNNITLDKRKMLFDKDIDSLGTYKIPIQLHKEVTATITLYVVEK